MTEAEWQDSGDPGPMLASIPAERHQRELRLFCCSCVRRIWPFLPDAALEASRSAVEAAERFADGQASIEELRAASAAISDVADRLAPGGDVPEVSDYALSAVVDATSQWPRTSGNVAVVASCAAQAAGHAAAVRAGDDRRYDDFLYPAQAAESTAQAGLLRELIPLPPDAVTG